MEWDTMKRRYFAGPAAFIMVIGVENKKET